MAGLSGKKVVLFAAVFFLFVVFNFLLNHWIEDKTKEKPTDAADSAAQVSKQAQQAQQAQDSANSTEKAQPSGEATERIRVERGSDYTERIFYVGGEEVGRQKDYGNGKIEQIGRIPSGKVKFYDEYTGASGEEYYTDGKKSGKVKEYHSSGQLKSEAVYINGKLQTDKEYYSNGNPMFEVDYRDAKLGMENNKEVGIGKLYYLDGSLKYEWSFINGSNKSYRKSYNPDGSLRAEFYYDQFGHPIEKEPEKQAPAQK